MKRANVLPVLIAALLSGCQSAGDRAFTQANQDCKDASDGKVSIECVKKHPAYSQFSPDVQRFVNYSAAVHEQRRAGKLTTNEADLLTSEFAASIDRERAGTAAQSQASNAAMANTGAALIAAGAPRPAAAQNVSCSTMGTMTTTTYGGMTNCRAY